MDNPIVSTNFATLPGYGPHVIEARSPATLQARANALLAALSASIVTPAAIHSWEITGGGGGANWRLVFNVGFSVGWGLNTKLPLQLAQFAFRAAQHHEQLRAQTVRMYADLPVDSFVWGTKFAGSARDGTYLCGVLWSSDSDGFGKPTTAAESFEEVGPFDAPTNVLGLVIPAQPVNILCREYFLHYSILLNDTTGASGVFGRLILNGATVFESRITEAATDWYTFSGVLHETQAAVLHQYNLQIDVVGVNQVTCRGAVMAAHLVTSESSEA